MLLSGALGELVNRFSVKEICCADSSDCMAGLSLLVGEVVEVLRWEEILWLWTVMLLRFSVKVICCADSSDCSGGG